MNKFTSIILAFILIFFGFAVIANASVSAAGEAVTPDDAFEGNYTEFKGNDGSVTRVFENGSVSTKNKDGSTTAVDYKGNQYSEDKDGNYSVRLTNGETATEYADGRQSMTDINGKIFTVYPDGHITEEYPHLGLVVDSNVDGETLGIGLIGSDERIKADEYGFYENGEIKGKDGSSLTITDDGVNWINAEGNKYDFKETGNTCTVSANYKDGSYCESTLISSGDNGNRTENTDYLFVTADGTRWDGNKNITYDADGNPVYSNNDVMQVTGTDGSTLWIDNNSKASEYSGADGNRIVTDKNGNLTEYKDGENDWNVTYDENGNVVSSYMTFPDGTRIEKHPDGSEIFVTPDGTKYEADGKGNVFKDGEQIKKDGKWLPGNEPNEGTENSSPGTEPNATTDNPSSGNNNGLPMAGAEELNGIWSVNERASGRAYRITMLTDHTLKWEEVFITTEKDGNKIEEVRKEYVREYNYDPESGMILIQRTLTGKTDADGSPNYILSMKITVADGENGQKIMNQVMSPVEIEGTPEHEYKTEYYLRTPK